MDSDTSEIKNDKAEVSNIIPDAWNVFQPFWLRRHSTIIDKVDRILLRSEFGFVLPCGILFWIIFLLFG